MFRYQTISATGMCLGTKMFRPCPSSIPTQVTKGRVIWVKIVGQGKKVGRYHKMEETDQIRGFELGVG